MLLRSRVAACLSPLIACLPITPAAAQDTDDVAVGSGDIVVLGTRRARGDGTLSSDIATRTLSQSSRSIERDLLTAAGAYRLSDALELVSGKRTFTLKPADLEHYAGARAGRGNHLPRGFQRVDTLNVQAGKSTQTPA